MGNIGVYVTQRCNLKCKYCFAEKEYGDVNCNDVIKFINQYSKDYIINQIQITGGEPLLYGDLKKLIIKSKEYTENITIMTNGILLNDEWLNFFEENNISLNISLDSISSNYHNKLRGNFEDTIRILKRLSNYNIKTTISMTVSHENIEEINKINLYAEKIVLS